METYMPRMLRPAALLVLLLGGCLPASAAARSHIRCSATRVITGHRAGCVVHRTRLHRVRARLASTPQRALPAPALAPARAAPASAPAVALSSPVHCDLYASPAGSDARGTGSVTAPFSSVQKLDQTLAAGQTGCLRAGTYGSVSTLHRIYANGSAAGRLTIRSAPNEVATIVGYVDIEGSYTTLSHLRIDGSNTFYTAHPAGVSCPAPVSQPLGIEGTNDTLEYDDYFQSIPSLRSTGIGIGFWANADNTIIRYTKVHDVGQCQAYDHLIYLSHGNNVQIYDNWLYNDAHGRGVQLYPAPTNARVFANIIDHVGEGFVVGDEVGATPTGNRIYNNLVTNATGLPTQGILGEAIHDLYGGLPGTGNAFYNNLTFNDPGGLGRLTAVSAYGNVSANPQFINPAAGNFAVATSSPAVTWHLWSGLS
jgi:hypothetical protein